jgi:hypothetical protein
LQGENSLFFNCSEDCDILRRIAEVIHRRIVVGQAVPWWSVVRKPVEWGRIVVGEIYSGRGFVGNHLATEDTKLCPLDP